MSLPYKVIPVLILALVSEAIGQTLAFPGAEGFGRFSVGGRGGRVIYVSTAAAFKAACEDSSGARIVIPTLGATYDYTSLDGDIEVTKAYLTVPFQCVPGSGILLKECTFKIFTHDVIIRNGRGAHGDDVLTGVNPTSMDTWQIGGGGVADSGYNVIIDHSTGIWSVDENFSVGDSAERVTISWCISAWGLYGTIHPEFEHSKGMLWHSTSADSNSFINNLLAHNEDRNSRLVGDGIMDYSNNYAYNYSGPTQAGTDSRLQFRRNYFKPGPNTPANKYGIVSGGGALNTLTMYLEGNLGHNRLTDSGPDSLITNISSAYQTSAPLILNQSTAIDVDTIASTYLLNRVGPWPRTAIEDTIIAQVTNGGGNIINGYSVRTLQFPAGAIIGWGRGGGTDTVKVTVSGIGNLSNRYAGYQYVTTSGTGSGQTNTITNSTVQAGPGVNLLFNTPFATALCVTSCELSGGVTNGYVAQTVIAPVSPVAYPTMTPGTAVVDTDLDGLPDKWEIYFGGTATSISPTSDPDGDGWDRMDNYMAACMDLQMAGLDLNPRYRR